MLSLHTNAASLSTQNSLGSTNKALSTSMTRLGTGLRVNSAMDDAAGLQVATRLNAQSRGMQVAQKNTQNGISLLQTGEGALAEVQNILLRMKDLATESANATASAADRTAMQDEFEELGKEMANIMGNTKFAGENLFTSGVSTALETAAGTLGGAKVTFQIGSDAAEKMELVLSKAANTTATPPVAASGVQATLDALKKVSSQFANTPAAAADKKELKDQTEANKMIGTINTAMDAVSALRSSLGAAANRLEHTYNNLGNMIQNTEAAKGRIMDVDYATETSNMTSKQMLMQASTSMLKQSNSMSQMVASLLQ